jgi:Putative Flp pilus-assembly TadE/G-like
VDTRFPIRRSTAQRGATAVQILVILVPVLFGLIGFAIDLGIMYVVKGELKTAANSMALAAAQQLIGTDAAIDAASAAAQLTVLNSANVGNKYDFNGLAIGQTNNNLESTAPPPSYFATAASAIAAGGNGGVGGVGGSQAKYAVATISGQIPLVFWNFLPIVTSRNIAVVATAVAGISAPLCTACGIEPFAVSAIDQTDTTDFGYTLNELYSFTYLCTGIPVPAPLAGAAQELSYVLLNRLDPNAVVYPDETSQIFRDAAGGLPGNTNSAIACFTINNTEVIWVNAAPVACSAAAPAPVVTDALCGLDSRFEVSANPACEAIAGSDVLSTIYPADTDLNSYTVYTDYTGDGRRIITIPIVDAISATANMTVLGFRQFLLMPAQGGIAINPDDPNGRFVAMYIGSVAPVKQGRFDGCQQAAGPGKVVLHQ